MPSPSPLPVPQPPTEAEINDAFNVLARAHKAVAHDAGLTAVFQRRVNIEVLGRPSGASPPPPAELPASPPAWWRDRTNETPDQWLEIHYKAYIGKGLTRGFFQRPGQDKAFANALLRWENEPQGGVPGAPKNKLPPDLYIPTRTELLDRELQERGGVAAPPTRPYVSTPEVRQAARLYQAVRRRLG